ncbi:MAG: sensor histidine kinase, partial [Minicystis sp.]
MKSPLRIPRGVLPILPIAPVIVVIVGITTAVVIAFLGISQLQETNDDAARSRAEAISATIAARLRSTAIEDRGEVIGRAWRRSAAEILLVDQEGQILVNESYGTPSKEEVVRLLTAGTGPIRTSLGRARFAARD